jgi:hypothetical protein
MDMEPELSWYKSNFVNLSELPEYQVGTGCSSRSIWAQCCHLRHLVVQFLYCDESLQNLLLMKVGRARESANICSNFCSFAGYRCSSPCILCNLQVLELLQNIHRRFYYTLCSLLIVTGMRSLIEITIHSWLIQCKVLLLNVIYKS